MATPSAIIYICAGVPINSRYEHTLRFYNANDQESYFAGKVVKTVPASLVVRRSWALRVPGTLPDAEKWTYCYYKNAGCKPVYCFINRVEYVNEGMVEIHCEVDVLQTYFFRISFSPCFIERQHTTTDDVGDHTVDEGLELGELVDASVNDVEALKELCVMILATYRILTTSAEGEDTVYAAKHNGIFSGLMPQAASMDDWKSLGVKLDLLAEAGKLDGVVSMWMYPKAIVTLDSGYSWTDGKVTKDVDSIAPLFVHAQKPTTLGTYGEPRNKKLLTYPFNMLYVTNNAGNAAKYRYERFSADDIIFQLSGCYSPDATVRMFPKNYNNAAVNYDYGITLSGFPTCAWNSDAYKIWLAQNQNSQNMSVATAGLSIVAGAGAAIGGLITANPIAVAGGAGAAISGATQIGNLLAQRADAEVQPNQARGVYSSNVNITAGKQTFTMCQKCVSYEQAAILDDYFTMYGYKVNRIGVPNVNARRDFVYTKTVGCHVSGDIPNEDARTFEAIFDKGVTFWDYGVGIGNYGAWNPCGL